MNVRTFFILLTMTLWASFYTSHWPYTETAYSRVRAGQSGLSIKPWKLIRLVHSDRPHLSLRRLFRKLSVQLSCCLLFFSGWQRSKKRRIQHEREDRRSHSGQVCVKERGPTGRVRPAFESHFRMIPTTCPVLRLVRSVWLGNYRTEWTN